jgi:hypothetical protein
MKQFLILTALMVVEVVFVFIGGHSQQEAGA